MPQASITINAVVGSKLTLPINTLVQLDNQNIGGELSYLWEILDQPPLTADVLSSAVLQNPTFTPKKEGTYLIKLTVNSGLVTEQTQTVVAAVQQLKTLERIPAAGEVLEADTADGWAVSMNSLLRRVDLLLSDPGIIVGVNASGGALTRGQVVRCTAASIIKSTLPGQETVPGFSLSTAGTLAEVDELLAVVEGTPANVASVANGGLMKVRYIGRIAAQVIAGGAVAVGDVIFLNDAGALSKTAGTVRRRVGSAMTAGATADVWFNGVGGADIDLTPIDRAYMVHGPLGALPNGIRTDDSNATPSVTGFRWKSGAVGTTPMTVQGFAGQTADLFHAMDSAGGLLFNIDAQGRFVTYDTTHWARYCRASTKTATCSSTPRRGASSGPLGTLTRTATIFGSTPRRPVTTRTSSETRTTRASGWSTAPATQSWSQSTPGAPTSSRVVRCRCRRAPRWSGSSASAALSSRGIRTASATSRALWMTVMR
jgi:hypothetical protein